MRLLSFVLLIYVFFTSSQTCDAEVSCNKVSESENCDDFCHIASAEAASMSFLQTALDVTGARAKLQKERQLGTGSDIATLGENAKSGMGLFIGNAIVSHVYNPCVPYVSSCILPLQDSFALIVGWLIVLLLTVWTIQGCPCCGRDLHGLSDNLLTRLLKKPSGTHAPAAELLLKPQDEALVQTDFGRRLPCSLTIPDLVEEHAECWPEVSCLQIWSPKHVMKTMTFKALAEHVHSASSALSFEGVAVGMRLAMLSHGTETYHVYLLGCMRVGAVPVLLNWQHPLEQLVSMAKVASCEMVLTSMHFEEQASALQQALALPDRPVVLEHMERSVGLQPCMPAILRSSDCAVVFFTSGRTSTPKAVPHDHAAFLWSCSNILVAKAPAFPPRPNGGARGGTVCFLPNYQTTAFTGNFLFNLYVGASCSVLKEPHATPITPDLLLQACTDVRPSVLSTVPSMIQVFCIMLRKGDASADCLKKLHHIACAGAHLPEGCAAVLAKHKILAQLSFGQKELAGPVLLSKMGGDLQFMRSVPGVTYVLRAPGSQASAMAQGHQTKGELVLYRVQSATSGYLRGSDGRPLCAADSDTRWEYWTGDIFEEASMPDGSIWLRHCFRDDEILVHTNGEMTNPIPTEHILTELPAVHAACVLGDRLERPVLVLELHCGESPSDLAEEVWAQLQRANHVQPECSKILPRDVVCLWRWEDEGVPVDAEGNIQRRILHERMEPTLAFLLSDGPPPSERAVNLAKWLQENLPQSDDASSSCMDPLLLINEPDMRIEAQQGYFYFVCLVGLVLRNVQESVFKHIGPQSLLDSLVEGTNNVFAAVSLQGFTLLSGFKDLQSPPAWHSVFQLFVLTFSGEVFQRVTNSFIPLNLPEYVHPQLWYLWSLLLMKIVFLVTQGIGTPAGRCFIRVLFGVTVNFASACEGSWPFFYRMSPASRQGCTGLNILPSSLNSWLVHHLNNPGNYLFIFYFAFSYVFKYLSPMLSGAYLQRAVCALFALLLVFWQVQFFHGLQDVSIAGYDANRSWLDQAGHDIMQHVVQFALLACIYGALPKGQNIFSDAGGNSLMVYYLKADLMYVLVPFCVFINAVTSYMCGWMNANLAALVEYVSVIFVCVFLACFLGIATWIPYGRYLATSLFMIVLLIQYYLCNWLLFSVLSL